MTFIILSIYLGKYLYERMKTFISDISRKEFFESAKISELGDQAGNQTSAGQALIEIITTATSCSSCFKSIDIRNIILAIVVGFFSSNSDTLGQSTTIGTASKKGTVSIGITAGHYDYDPAIGLEITSPGILNNFRFRLKVNHNWSEQYQAASGHWANFNSYWCALIYNTDPVDRTRIFLESGAYLIQPNKVFSSAKIHTGCFAAIGVEFFVAPNTRERFSYFFSGGFAAINARADKLEGRPRYGQGMIFTNGFRYFFLPK